MGRLYLSPDPAQRESLGEVSRKGKGKPEVISERFAAVPEHASTLVDLQSQLTLWREQTNDPLLDAKNLQRLTAEVTAVTNKSEGKSTQWGCVDYFFGKEANPTVVESSKKKKRKKKQ